MTSFIRVLTAITLALVLLAPMAFAEGQQEEIEATDPTGNPWTDGQDLSGTEVEIFGAFVDEEAAGFEDTLERFIEQTGINVTYEGSADFESLVMVRAEGGDEPDIALFPQPGLMADVYRQGYIENPAEWFGEDFLEERYDSDLIDITRVDGEIAGAWARTNVKSLVWYSVPLFEEEGYEIPETWDELMDLSDQMVADGHYPWSIGIEAGGATGWLATDWLQDIMFRIHEPEVYDDWITNDVQFDSPEVREAFNILEEIWFDDDYVLGGTDAILTVPYTDATTPLITQDAAMFRQASFAVEHFPDGTEIAPDGDVWFFPFPEIEPEYGQPVVIAGDIASPMTDRPEVRAVMRFIADPEGLGRWVEEGGLVSPHLDAELDWYPEVEREFAEIFLEAEAFRFDAADMMPGPVGTGTFWEGVVDWTQGDDLDDVLPAIDAGFPED